MTNQYHPPKFRFLSVCSGIEAASEAWEGLGEPVAFSEIDPFASALLAHHYPETLNLGDMNNYEQWKIQKIDLLVGGCPCQSFSVAGLRGGLNDDRGNLTLTFCHIADKFDPEWVLWENVPGVLSDASNAFGCFLGKLCGASKALIPDGRWARAGVVSGPKRTVAWRVLDAQWFGVPQRRKRVFVLAVRGSRNWRCAEALLPFGESLPRYFEEMPRKKQRDTRKIESCLRSPVQAYALESKESNGMNSKNPFTGCCNETETSKTIDTNGTSPACNQGGMLVYQQTHTSNNFKEIAVMGALTCEQNNHVRGDTPLVTTPPVVCDRASFSSGRNAQFTPCVAETETSPTIIAKGPPAVLNYASSRYGQFGLFVKETETAPTLIANGPHAVCIQGNLINRALTSGPQGIGIQEELAYTLTSTDIHAVSAPVVRRLTPRECERLMGFPDDYTRFTYKNKPAPDGARYKALGNSMVVPVMRWIGEQILKQSRLPPQ